MLLGRVHTRASRIILIHHKGHKDHKEDTKSLCALFVLFVSFVVNLSCPPLRGIKPVAIILL